MSFRVEPEDVRKSQKCPPGMHMLTLVKADDEYFNEKGTKVQCAYFESSKGYEVRYWFNDGMIGSLIEFVSAADNVSLSTEEFAGMDINLKEYVGKRVAGSISHVKDKNNKIQAQIDNFFSADKIPF